MSNSLSSHHRIRFFKAQYQPTDRPIEDRITVAQPGLPSDNRTLAGVFDGKHLILVIANELQSLRRV
jgi:hypothetical protein